MAVPSPEARLYECMYIKKNRDASTKYDLPVHVLLTATRDRSRDDDDDDIIGEKHHYERKFVIVLRK